MSKLIKMLNDDTTQILLAIVIGIIVCWFIFRRNGGNNGFSVGAQSCQGTPHDARNSSCSFALDGVTAITDAGLCSLTSGCRWDPNVPPPQQPGWHQPPTPPPTTVMGCVDAQDNPEDPNNCRQWGQEVCTLAGLTRNPPCKWMGPQTPPPTPTLDPGRCTGDSDCDTNQYCDIYGGCQGCEFCSIAEDSFQALAGNCDRCSTTPPLPTTVMECVDKLGRPEDPNNCAQRGVEPGQAQPAWCVRAPACAWRQVPDTEPPLPPPTPYQLAQEVEEIREENIIRSIKLMLAQLILGSGGGPLPGDDPADATWRRGTNNPRAMADMERLQNIRDVAGTDASGKNTMEELQDLGELYGMTFVVIVNTLQGTRQHFLTTSPPYRKRLESYFNNIKIAHPCDASEGCPHNEEEERIGVPQPRQRKSILGDMFTPFSLLSDTKQKEIYCSRNTMHMTMNLNRYDPLLKLRSRDMQGYNKKQICDTDDDVISGMGNDNEYLPVDVVNRLKDHLTNGLAGVRPVNRPLSDLEGAWNKIGQRDQVFGRSTRWRNTKDNIEQLFSTIYTDPLYQPDPLATSYRWRPDSAWQCGELPSTSPPSTAYSDCNQAPDRNREGLGAAPGVPSIIRDNNKILVVNRDKQFASELTRAGVSDWNLNRWYSPARTYVEAVTKPATVRPIEIEIVVDGGPSLSYGVARRPDYKPEFEKNPDIPFHSKVNEGRYKLLFIDGMNNMGTPYQEILSSHQEDAARPAGAASQTGTNHDPHIQQYMVNLFYVQYLLLKMFMGTDNIYPTNINPFGNINPETRAQAITAPPSDFAQAVQGLASNPQNEQCKASGLDYLVLGLLHSEESGWGATIPTDRTDYGKIWHKPYNYKPELITDLAVMSTQEALDAGFTQDQLGVNNAFQGSAIASHIILNNNGLCIRPPTEEEEGIVGGAPGLIGRDRKRFVLQHLDRDAYNCKIAGNAASCWGGHSTALLYAEFQQAAAPGAPGTGHEELMVPDTPDTPCDGPDGRPDDSLCPDTSQCVFGFDGSICRDNDECGLTFHPGQQPWTDYYPPADPDQRSLKEKGHCGDIGQRKCEESETLPGMHNDRLEVMGVCDRLTTCTNTDGGFECSPCPSGGGDGKTGCL